MFTLMRICLQCNVNPANEQDDDGFFTLYE